MSLNRWVFKWRLNVEMLSHSLMSAGKEFQMDVVGLAVARWKDYYVSSGSLNSTRSHKCFREL